MDMRGFYLSNEQNSYCMKHAVQKNYPQISGDPENS